MRLKADRWGQCVTVQEGWVGVKVNDLHGHWGLLGQQHLPIPLPLQSAGYGCPASE